MRSSPRLLACWLAVLLLVPSLATAGSILVPGVGTRASALGGAFIGLADDYSAVHWNPAGITQIDGVEVTVAGGDCVPLGSREGFIQFEGVDGYDVPVQEAIEATTDSDHHLTPGLFAYSGAGPLCGVFDKVGIAVYTLSDYGVLWTGEEVYGDLIARYVTIPDNPSGYRQVMGEAPDHESNIRSYAISPVVAKEIIPGLSIGVSGHAVYSHFEQAGGGWYEETYYDSSKLHPVTYREDLTGWTYGATVGVLYRASQNLSVGATVRTPMTITYEGDIKVNSTFDALNATPKSESFDFTYPMWVGGGLAYRNFLFDDMTLTADVQWTQWSTVDKIERDISGELPIGDMMQPLDWDDTINFAFGIDYRLSRQLSLAFGYRNEPSPVPDETFDFTMTQVGQNVVGAAVGYRQELWELNAGFSYYMSEKREITSGAMYGKHVLDALVPSVSFTYSF